MTSTKNFYVVGIGASAGGLEAIETFFSNVPADSGLAYIIVQHLSPDYISLMPEILIKRTSLPLHTAEDGMRVEPNNIYLIPRKMNMKIFQSKLHLTEKNNLHILNLPIDIFLQSLAEDFEDKSVAVILSGTGSDGSRGIRTIKENGGIIIAQDPDSAKFDGMPKSAISTGTVDFVLQPQEMPAKIVNYVKHPYIIDKNKINDAGLLPEDYLSKIVLLLRESSGVDFTSYKEATISRRIERRLSINQIDNLKEYVDFLTISKNEQKILYKELLIGVTKFFRDTEAFLFVENEIIPQIFEHKENNDEIRIWISACSTGEEAYSVAILFKEYMIRHNLKKDIKIFASDVDKSAIEYASTGTYSASISTDVSLTRLNNFFTPIGDSFRINENIREMIVFASHNIIKDPPFNKIDFLSCRNLLIYFQPILQQKVLSFFNYALNRNGFMFLGNSESLGEMESFYETVSHKWKIYKSLRNAKLPNDTLSTKFPGGITQNYQVKKPLFTLKNSLTDLINVFTEKILADNAPVTVIVNEDAQIINSFGNLKQYLEFPDVNRISEGFDFTITQTVPENLRLTFGIAINKALKTLEPVVYQNIKYQKSANEIFIVDIKFSPLSKKDINTKYVLIYFITKEIAPVIQNEIHSYENIDQLAYQRIKDLETELKHSKENLQASIEELETTNEELQSTNEELISSNEELQSTNEELQSVNEELYTVNTEFQSKNHDLVVANNDMENLLQNSEIPIIFLDKNLQIRKFTENIVHIFNLKKTDIGRPISDITNHLENIDIPEVASNVLKGIELHQIVKARQKLFQLNVIQYTTQKGFVDGVVLSFIDITNLMNTREELLESESLLKTIIEIGIDAFYLLKSKKDSKGKILDFIIADVNKQAEKQMNMKREDLIGYGICELFPVNVVNGFFEKYKKVAETGIPYDNEYSISSEFAAPGWYYHQIVPVKNGIIIFNRDISEKKNYENQLVESRNLYQSIFENMTNGFALHEIILDQNKQPINYRFITVNDSFCNITNLNKENVVGKTVLEVIPDIEKQWIEIYGKVALTGETYSFEMEAKPLGKKFKVNAFSPKKGQFAVIFNEI